MNTISIGNLSTMMSRLVQYISIIFIHLGDSKESPKLALLLFTLCLNCKAKGKI